VVASRLEPPSTRPWYRISHPRAATHVLGQQLVCGVLRVTNGEDEEDALSAEVGEVTGSVMGQGSVAQCLRRRG
jgi:hypothetical protein